MVSNALGSEQIHYIIQNWLAFYFACPPELSQLQYKITSKVTGLTLVKLFAFPTMHRIRLNLILKWPLRQREAGVIMGLLKQNNVEIELNLLYRGL